MKKLDIVPFEGIGILKLGDKREETDFKIKVLLKEAGINEESLMVSRDYIAEGGYTRYFAENFFVLVNFDPSDRAVEIGIDKETRASFDVRLFDMDIFKTPAFEAVDALKARSPLICDLPDEDLSYDYEFPEIGVRLWRDGVFHPKLLKDESYMEEMKLTLEDEKEFLYFNIATVKIR